MSYINRKKNRTGIEIKRREMIKKMHENNITIDIIAKCVSLPIEDVKIINV